jgi:hypothetical protein
MASDISLAVGDGARRMTYAELATVRGISQASARRLVLRHHWPRQRGNDGIVRVTVPLTALVKGAETTGLRVTMTGPATWCRRYLCWNLFSAVSGRTRILDQAARSIGSLTSLCVNVCHPSTLRMVI